MKEKDFQVLLTKWFKVHNRECGGLEAKICSTALPFSAVKEHQVNALLRVSLGTFVHKISDFSPGLKPFDMVFLHKTVAYVGVLYWKAHKYKEAYLIPIESFLLEKSRSTRKSLTNEAAARIGIKIDI